MFSNITSFLWGSSAPASSGISLNDADTNPSKTDEIIDSCIESRLSPDALISLSSLSDEEADWVFVNNGNNGNSSAKEDLDSDHEELAERSERLERLRRMRSVQESPSTNPPEPCNRVVTRGAHNNNTTTSAFSAESALKALQAKVLRPEQKAQRRDKELRLKHKHLERTNMCRMVESSSNRPHKRKSRYTPTLSSRAVNNRKC